MRILALSILFSLMAILPVGATSFARNQCGDTALYDRLYGVLSMGKDTFEVDGKEFSDISPIYEAVLTDNSGLFYVDGTLEGSEKSVDGVLRSTTLIFSYMDDLWTKSHEVEKAVRKILPAMKSLDDIGKARYAYAYLISTSVYDKNYPDQSLYSILVEHRGVCAGFARAFQYLMDQSGVECIYVTGYLKKSGEPHSWNIIRVNGECCHVDVTMGEGASGDDIDYSAFGLSDSQISKTHVMETNYRYPSCDTEKWNSTFLMQSPYRRENVAFILQKHHDEQSISLEYDSLTNLRDAYRDLVVGKGLMDLYYDWDMLVNDFSYTIDEDRYILKIVLPDNIERKDILRFTRYDRKEIKEAIQRETDRGGKEVTLRFSHADDYDEAINDLITEKGFFGLFPETRELRYAEDERRSAITFYF